jgi:hypothetical protein
MPTLPYASRASAPRRTKWRFVALFAGAVLLATVLLFRVVFNHFWPANQYEDFIAGWFFILLIQAILGTGLLADAAIAYLAAFLARKDV